MRYNNQPTISVIGAGRVGSTLAMLLYRAGYRIGSVISQKKNTARKLAHRVHCNVYSNALNGILPTTRIILMAVPEEKIMGIAKEISILKHLNISTLTVFHTSGSLTSDALMPLKEKGALTFSLHPIQTFSKGLSLAKQITQMQNVIYGFEGSKKAIPLARQLARAVGGHIVIIPKEEKILYHSACVFASNYSIALLGIIDDLVNYIGGGIKLVHFKPIIRTSIENAFRQSPGMALTGPIARGSTKTVESHLNELRKTDKSMAYVYQQIGLQALKMAMMKRSIPPKVAKQIRHILES